MSPVWQISLFYSGESESCSSYAATSGCKKKNALFCLRETVLYIAKTRCLKGRKKVTCVNRKADLLRGALSQPREQGSLAWRN
jgi:hypothetical protein